MRVVKNTLKKRIKVYSEDEVSQINTNVENMLTSVNGEQDQATNEFKQKSVDDMTDAEVLNFAFINQPKDIDTAERQSLMTRAADISKKQQNQSSSEHKKFVNNIASYANNFNSMVKNL